METKPSIDGTIIESQEFSEVEELLPVVREKMSCVKKENPPREKIKDFLAFNSITLKELADKLNSPKWNKWQRFWGMSWNLCVRNQKKLKII